MPCQYTNMICLCFIEDKSAKTKHLVRMLEFLDGVSVIRVGVSEEVAYKGGIFVAQFCNAVKVIAI